MLNGSAMTDCCDAASHIYRQNGLQCQRVKGLLLWLYLNKVVGDKTRENVNKELLNQMEGRWIYLVSQLYISEQNSFRKYLVNLF